MGSRQPRATSGARSHLENLARPSRPDCENQSNPLPAGHEQRRSWGAFFPSDGLAFARSDGRSVGPIRPARDLGRRPLLGLEPRVLEPQAAAVLGDDTHDMLRRPVGDVGLDLKRQPHIQSHQPDGVRDHLLGGLASVSADVGGVQLYRPLVAPGMWTGRDGSVLLRRRITHSPQLDGFLNQGRRFDRRSLSVHLPPGHLGPDDQAGVILRDGHRRRIPLH